MKSARHLLAFFSCEYLLMNEVRGNSTIICTGSKGGHLTFLDYKTRDGILRGSQLSRSQLCLSTKNALWINKNAKDKTCSRSPDCRAALRRVQSLVSLTNDSEAEKFSKSRKCITYASWRLLLIIEAIMHIVNIDHLTSDPLKSDKVKESVWHSKSGHRNSLAF